MISIAQVFVVIYKKDAAAYVVFISYRLKELQTTDVQFTQYQLHHHENCEPHGLSHVELLSFHVQLMMV